MYDVWRVGDGQQVLIDTVREFETARARVIEQSSLSSHVYVVVRHGFGQALLYAHQGRLTDDAALVLSWSVTTVPPSASEQEMDDTAPRRRRGPSETKARGAGPQTFKQFSTEITAIDVEQGIVEAIVSVFGIVDDGGDIIHPGAFVKTLAENGTRVKVLDNHNARSLLNVIGRPLEIREVGRDELPPALLAQHPEATGGLYTKTQFLLDTPEGRGVFERIKLGVAEYSIGFDVLQEDASHVMVDGKRLPVRNIRQVRLWEYSPVIWGMNPATTTVAVKRVSGDPDLPLAPREYGWSASAAERRVRAWATDGDEIDWARYRRAFFWYDEDNPERLDAYKLGFADVIDGELRAIPRGIFAVAAALMGARGGVDIPAGEVAGVKSRVERYYARMREEFDDEGIQVPWARETESGAGPDEHKEGRVLSAANFNRIKQAYDLLREVMEQAGFETGDQPSSGETGSDQQKAAGPSSGQNAPTPAGKAEPPGAGPQAERATPDVAHLLAELDQRLAELG